MARARADRNTGVRVTRHFASEVADVVRIVKGGDRRQPGITFRHNTPGSQQPRHGSISATVTKGGTTTVTRLHSADDSPFDPTETFEARSPYATITVPSGQTRTVLCHMVEGTWLIGSAECG
jgi:hypothetical protein